ncbi:hypothetical protein K2173_010022 [Erythroxylum novogranatense]|uniref:RPM1 interacting protein 13 n=1 Tax=Erythroxylum novogranatense TaxID=1862640 RepID=A0AAV8S4T5_9ROSI|nr:hypothetical protein K2173_010022 [Erythroxylum novogranatense]
MIKLPPQSLFVSLLFSLMASSYPQIFDISSDEEPVFDNPRVGDDDYNWFTEILQTVDKDFDEVMIVGETNTSNSKSKSKSSKLVEVNADDDCVVLDGDPDIPVPIVKDADNDGDDILVVGQKGQIACRDYPHSRHLCAKFPFNSTPHERHCILCHCYVCDSRAPCVHWGTGVSRIGHCHATDKHEIWKLQREEFRLKKKKEARLLTSNCPYLPCPVEVPQVNQVVALDNIQLGTNSISINQVPRLTEIRACTSSILSTPGIVGQSKVTQPRTVQGRNGVLPRGVAKHALGVRSRRSTVGNFGPPFVPTNAMFKRPGPIRGALTSNHHFYGSSNSSSSPPTYPTSNPTSITTSRNQIFAGQQNHFSNMSLGLSMPQSLSLPNMETGAASLMPILPQVSNQHIPPSNDSHNMSMFRNESQNIWDPRLTDFDYSWVDDLSQSNQQSVFEAELANNVPTTVNQRSSQTGGGIQVPYKINENDGWYLEQSPPLVLEGSNLKAISPGPPAVDVGMLYFDFETSWNSLAHA